MPSVAAAAAVTLATLDAAVVLQRGDNDARRTWGGRRHDDRAGRPVHELQQALVAVGAMNAAPDGDFGRKTQDAVKRLQWYVGAIAWRLRVPADSDVVHGVLEPYAPPAGMQVDGFVHHATRVELLAWQAGGCRLTSPLVALSVAGLSNVELSSTFKVLDYPSPRAHEVLVHQDFAPRIEALNGAAKAAGVTLRLNQTFRVQGLPVSGAVVPPASSSQHLIGNAVDLNIVDGDIVNTSAMFIAGTQTQRAKDFVKAAKALGLRWGDDFTPRDPPHFDDFVPPSGADYLNAFYFSQRSYAARHPMRRA